MSRVAQLSRDLHQKARNMKDEAAKLIAIADALIEAAYNLEGAIDKDKADAKKQEPKNQEVQA